MPKSTADTVSFFEQAAKAWDLYGEPMTAQFVPAALDIAGGQPGQRLLDVGAGSGALAHAAAEARLDVLAVDISPEMIARCRKRLEPYPEADVAEMDAEALDLEDASFDIVTSMCGATCCSDWHKSLSEAVRVTRPGGRIIIGHWEHADGPLVMQILTETMKRVVPEASGGWVPPAHSVDSLRTDLTNAGCENIEISPVRRVSTWPRIDQFVEEIDPLFRFSPDYAVLDDEQRQKLAGPLRDALAPYADPTDGIVRTEDVALIATATRPTAQPT